MNSVKKIFFRIFSIGGAKNIRIEMLIKYFFFHFSCTRDDRREKIVAAGNSVRQALQDLLGEYLANAGEIPTDQLDYAIDNMCRKTQDLR